MIKGRSLRTADGEIGEVKDLYFDDHQWRIRYLVVDTGGWLSVDRVLISPECLGLPESESKTIPASLTKDQVESSPRADIDDSLSPADEAALRGHYGWPNYWSALPMPVPVADPVIPAYAAADVDAEAERYPRSHTPAAHRLHRFREVLGWNTQATDGDFGQVADVLINPERDWTVTQVVIDTHHWFPGPTVLMAPLWISEMDRENRWVEIKLDQETIKDAPRIDATDQINPDYEAELEAHYQSALMPR